MRVKASQAREDKSRRWYAKGTGDSIDYDSTRIGNKGRIVESCSGLLPPRLSQDGTNSGGMWIVDADPQVIGNSIGVVLGPQGIVSFGEFPKGNLRRDLA
ncbi:hypothetical protein R1flu_021289 [Riccia fluitans]|uniref:Uncharacterized protein n=1 Tax=Riccia fluitans TaxID=41844 RepID=A0ABD1ZNY9_9MARC